ncbi:hypothetical protein PPL_01110 [Heterostelium album PN500]|uniref:Uncharacterized protein n=1 Tax=Heterostelium pallidum (strain ATCC 26659 / Pp 5 / PN500) TaxID=670386 RepID=D3AY51_HETP5|nr:hypothetical protein PPL_01110 [Heterostelium album PN500]EFA85878.1 hypothetical protein PPL_01110 [Heterostelium album PN500]|eukprot:XP_020437984.1 hypothetical protein PPL_01110 [Heterostelium album PN500]
MFKKIKDKTTTIATNVKDKVSEKVTSKDEKEKIHYVVMPTEVSKVKGGFVVGFGSNHENQFALGPKQPAFIKTLTGLECTYPLDISYVSAGADNIMFITKDNKYYYTGSNKVGQSGSMNASSPDNAVQNTSSKISNSKRIFCGPYHTAFLSDKGELQISGKGDLNGQPTDDNKATPHPIPALKNKKIALYSTGPRHSMVVDELGTVFAWGRADLLGLGQFVVVKKIATIKHEPTIVDCGPFLSRRVRQIACGDEHTLALLDNGVVYGWGRGEDGQLGHGVSETRQSPILIEPLKSMKITRLSCGMNNSAAITTTNDCYIWGLYHTAKMVPEKLTVGGAPLQNVQQISQNSFYNIVLANNHAYTFGADYKQSTEAQWNPVKVHIDDPFLLTKKITQVVASPTGFYLMVFEGSNMDEKLEGLKYGEAADKSVVPQYESQQQKNLNALLGPPRPKTSTTTTTTTTASSSLFAKTAPKPSSSTTSNNTTSISKGISNVKLDSDSDNDSDDDEEDEEEESVL